MRKEILDFLNFLDSTKKKSVAGTCKDAFKGVSVRRSIDQSVVIAYRSRLPERFHR